MYNSELKISGRKTAGAVVGTAGEYFLGIVGTTDGASNTTLTVYDNITSAGTMIVPTFLIPAASRSQDMFLPLNGYKATIGICVKVAGANAAYEAYTAH